MQPSSGRGTMSGMRAILLLLLVLVASLSGVVVVVVTDGTIAEVAVRPTGADPGPIAFSPADTLGFATTGSTQALGWYAEVVSAQDNASGATAVVQGTQHAFVDWFYLRHGSASRFVLSNATGVFDPAAASYSVPLLFSKSSQGSISITSYDGAAPDSPSATTWFWAYDAITDQYVFGPSKDLSGATRIDPIANTLGVVYEFVWETNPFVVTAVGAASTYVPTVHLGQHFTLLSLPGSAAFYVMMDPPAGVHEDTYTYRLRVSAVG